MLEINPNESIRICDEIIKNNINLGEAYYIKSCAYALLRDKKNAIIEYKFLAMDDRDFKHIKDDKEFYLTIHS